jgi:hypothetical protein
MCYEVCGPGSFADPKLQAEEDAAYAAWIDEQFPEDDEEETDERIEMSESEADEAFQEFVNETEPTITVMGLDYDPARVLKEVDPIAYRQEFLDWIDSCERDETHVFPWNT